MSDDTITDVYYDPYDVEVDVDPYPVFKRLRDEHPLYYNDRHDFFAVSRWDDCKKVVTDWRTYSSKRGTMLELLKADLTLPPGMFLFEDPPIHDGHRSVLGRVFTPRRMAEIEPRVRAFCARALDPFVGSKGFDFVTDLGAVMPMRVIGMLLGIPEGDQETVRDNSNKGVRSTLKDGTPTLEDGDLNVDVSLFNDYVDWRAQHPSDDLMTDLLNAEFEDETGTVRKLTREEVLNCILLIAGAGNETTTRLISWAAKVLAEHPDQRRELVEDRSLIPNAIEELLRYESPSPFLGRWVTEDVEHHGTKVPAGSIMLAVIAAANRDERAFSDPDRFDIHRKIDQHIAFGHGIHFCLGSHLARLEGRIALEEVMARFPEWEVDWDHAVQAHTTTVRGWEKMPVLLP